MAKNSEASRLKPVTQDTDGHGSYPLASALRVGRNGGAETVATDPTPVAGLGGYSTLPDERAGAAYRTTATRVQNEWGMVAQPTHSTMYHALHGDEASMDVARGGTRPHDNPPCNVCGATGHGTCFSAGEAGTYYKSGLPNIGIDHSNPDNI